MTPPGVPANLPQRGYGRHSFPETQKHPEDESPGHISKGDYFSMDTASEMVFSRASLPYLSTSALFFSP